MSDSMGWGTAYWHGKIGVRPLIFEAQYLTKIITMFQSLWLERDQGDLLMPSMPQPSEEDEAPHGRRDREGEELEKEMIMVEKVTLIGQMEVIVIILTGEQANLITLVVTKILLEF